MNDVIKKIMNSEDIEYIFGGCKKSCVYEI